MGTLFGFVVGYVLGARVGSRGFEEVLGALEAIRRSEEFAAFRALGTAHVRSVIGEVGARLAGQSSAASGRDDDPMAAALRRAEGR